MTPIRGEKIIDHARKDQNLFILEGAMPGQVMFTISKAMPIIRESQPTHLVS